MNAIVRVEFKLAKIRMVNRGRKRYEGECINAAMNDCRWRFARKT